MAKVSRTEIEKFVRKLVDEDKQYVDILSIMDWFKVSDVQAYRILLACQQWGLLWPTDRSYFTRPADGHPAPFVRPTRNTHVERRFKVQNLILGRPELGFTLREIYAELTGEISPPNNKLVSTRNVLYELCHSGAIMRRTAVGGGTFGKPPIIFGVNEAGIRARERQILVSAKKPGRKSNAVKAAQRDYDALMAVRVDRDLTGPELHEVVRLSKVIRGES
jgi:hypothetical protein